jgi:hypothetical protein
LDYDAEYVCASCDYGCQSESGSAQMVFHVSPRCEIAFYVYVLFLDHVQTIFAHESGSWCQVAAPPSIARQRLLKRSIVQLKRLLFFR